MEDRFSFRVSRAVAAEKRARRGREPRAVFRGGREEASQVEQGRVESSLSRFSVVGKCLEIRARWQGPNAKGQDMARKGKPGLERCRARRKSWQGKAELV